MTKNRENDIDYNLDVFKNFENFFDVTHDLFCVAGYDGYFKRINPAVSRVLEYSNEELFARPINDFVYKTDKDRTNTARNDLRSKIPLFDFENRYLTKSGQVVWLLWTSIPVENDQIIYAVAKNITHKKELEKERKQHLKQLTKINQEFKKISYSTAHDLRSPVNNMLAIFELMETSDIKNDETLEFLTILKSTADSLKENLDEHIRLINANNQSNEDTSLEEIELGATLNEVLISINSLIQNSEATIKIDFSKIDKINFNKSYLKSIFLNLITNAIKYAKPHTLSQISIRSEILNNATQLIISDNGIGFDMENVKDKIFGLHQTFSNHNDSNGIGLYLVHNYITSLGGKISLDSQLDEGATFTITFKD